MAKDLKTFKKMLDYREIGSTPFLGIQKPVLKAHGSSDALAFRNAIHQAEIVAKAEMTAQLEQSIAVLKEISND